MTSQTGQPIITIHTLPNISRSKSNQAMKFGQLMIRASPRLFYKKSKLSISLDRQSEMLKNLF